MIKPGLTKDILDDEMTLEEALLGHLTDLQALIELAPDHLRRR